ncbi:hypothetical protein [Aeromonas phage AS-yj]|uniref:Uncharacterized protein n=6 Tax=Caudoviricetes TaxID=2731619 RepID=A0A291LDZ3_9CAUD|nr:hypothetical protein F485_gp172 [Aeromonas phage CC2]YP_009834462.1 hypothetical protein HWB28_gp162 [Aeromonas phage AS-zj]ATI17606.1 hypothetical protein [Aeromonas phage AS-szw]ATI17901.1 hypothetical protein [Aeromonas phage AS-yj]QAX98047.1 hypothetical protein ASswx1_407 [Aeromonas phage Asswx_1]QAX98912.1 hypothetical protein assk_116 [Aeromonas phage Assk]QMV28820.1 hypothetical protein AP1_0113 [Aeromonas phage AP1]UKM62674.1 hypothetical protein P19_0186 [Aeromonas phage P19]
MSRSNELVEKAKQLAVLLKEVRDLAGQHDYGVELDTDSDEIVFNDWLSSSCYGEGGEGFTVSVDAEPSYWEESSC